METLLRNPGLDHVIIAGHSLGSVIALDALKLLSRRLRAGATLPLRKVGAFVTLGSPLDTQEHNRSIKVGYFFRENTPDGSALHAQLFSYLHATARLPSRRDDGPYSLQPLRRTAREPALGELPRPAPPHQRPARVLPRQPHPPPLLAARRPRALLAGPHCFPGGWGNCDWQQCRPGRCTLAMSQRYLCRYGLFALQVQRSLDIDGQSLAWLMSVQESSIVSPIGAVKTDCCCRPVRSLHRDSQNCRFRPCAGGGV